MNKSDNYLQLTTNSEPALLNNKIHYIEVIYFTDLHSQRLARFGPGDVNIITVIKRARNPGDL